MFQIASIQGDSGRITHRSTGAVVGIITKWWTVRSGARLGLRASFSGSGGYINRALMEDPTVKKSVIVDMRKNDPVELTYESWSFDGDQLVLDGVTNVRK